MKICNYYRGSTDKLTGYLFDTEKKTYRRFALSSKDWTFSKDYDKTDPFGRHGWYTFTKDGFRVPGDISYYFPTLCECNDMLKKLLDLGFVEDKNMPLDFGIDIKISTDDK